MKLLNLTSALIFSILFTGIALAQETTLKLPTNDNTSSFNITKNNGTSVLKVDGSGKMTGDGSGLSNVKSVVAYAQGNQSVYFHEGMIPGLNLYEAQKMREVTISCPGPGIIFASASGYCDWESKDEDLVRIWLYPHPTVIPTSSWQTPDFHNLRIVSDYKCADSSDQYTSWSITKTYTVSSAQNYTVSVCADKPFTSSKVLIGDVVLQLMYFPTGGTGSANFKIVTSNNPEAIDPSLPTMELFLSDQSTDGQSAEYFYDTLDGSPGGRKLGSTFEENANRDPGQNSEDKIKVLENEIAELNRKLNMLIEKLNQN
ncbi:MAG: hypothetical protein KKA84_04115 [Bacteroidetes bacterium]|nr:hypothetical protein [Bacteroidota bacterium]